MHTLLEDGDFGVTSTDAMYPHCVVDKAPMVMTQVEHRVGPDTGSAKNGEKLRS